VSSPSRSHTDLSSELLAAASCLWFSVKCLTDGIPGASEWLDEARVKLARCNYLVTA